MAEHKWRPDGNDKIGNAIEACGACGIRKIENCSTFWQRKKGARWIDEEDEEIPACKEVEAHEAAPARMTEEALVAALAAEVSQHKSPERRARQRAIFWEREAERARRSEQELLADNAALLSQLTKAATGHSSRMFWDDTDAMIKDSHPGAALLERMKRLEEALDSIQQVGGVRGGAWCAGQAIRALSGQELMPMSEPRKDEINV
jgi:hypothetical protein